VATPQPAPERENLAGLVERVTFHNEDSGFCVLRVKARGQRDLITVIGHAAAIGAGEFVQASGWWVNDRTHGVQFRADFLRAVPTTADGIEKYLASGMIKGIGPIYARPSPTGSRRFPGTYAAWCPPREECSRWD
jgi:exodeoxyribonuclease V alpha subunit